VRRIHRPLAIVAVIAAAACSGDSGRNPLAAPFGPPHFTITTVTVTCPDTISEGQTAQCTAYPYDEFHSYVSTTATWSTTTPSVLSVGSSGIVTGLATGNGVVQATAGGITGSKNVYVKPGLSLSIEGPSPVRRFDQCSWYVSVTGGTAPYAYSWSTLGLYASGPSDTYRFDGELVSGGGTLSVTVTDANGVQKTTSRSISGSLSAPYCWS
jgi:hypothetical protein